MPRARTAESENVVVVKKPRAPRARAASTVGTDAPAPRKRAPRKVAAKAIAVPESIPEPEPTTAHQRKAPTPIAAERRSKARTTRTFVVVIILCLVLTGAGVFVGMFDQGAIDVVAVVNSRNEQISRGEVRDASGQTVTSSVPVQTDHSGLHVADPFTPIAAPAAALPTPVASTTLPADVVGTSTTSSVATSSETTRDSALKPAL